MVGLGSWNCHSNSCLNYSTAVQLISSENLTIHSMDDGSITLNTTTPGSDVHHTVTAVGTLSHCPETVCSVSIH